VRVLLMGAPGAGKGTQAKLLEERTRAVHVSTGDMLRAAVGADTALGHEARSYMDRGLLVPDDVMIGLIAERLAATDCGPGFILDGFPRTVPQARALDTLLKKTGQALDAVLHIALPQEVAVERLAGRRMCRACGTIFQSGQGGPKGGHCERCAGSLIQRDDDREETILKRMEVYTRETAPVLEHYRKAGLLREVSGTGTRDDVFGRLLKSLPRA
jgi:adenylate kinase